MASETGSLDSKTDRFSAGWIHVSRRHRYRHQRRQRRLSIFAAIVAVSITTASVTVVGDSPALAALPIGDGIGETSPLPPSGGSDYFVFITTHGSPLWVAAARIYDENHVVKQEWRVKGKFFGYRSGGYAKFTFKDDSDLHIRIWVTGDNVGASRASASGPLDRSYCFLVRSDGAAKYTGDSITGGCNGK